MGNEHDASEAVSVASGDEAERRNFHLDTEKFLNLYRLMNESRFFDIRCNALIRAGEPVHHFHSGSGQEALMIGSVAPLRTSDQIIYTHRGYGHLMAKGVSVKEIALDAFMKAGGTNNGMGGIMHVSRPDLGVPGREGAFGTRFSVATGLALAAKLDGSDNVVICYYGEAAGARGILYEALNMAVIWKLPVIFIAENNGWSYSIRTDRLYPGGRMSRVWRGFDIPVREFDGNDVEIVYQEVSDAVQRARDGLGPSVLEGLTYRLDPHHWFDAAAYQPKDEVAAWRKRDPLLVAKGRLIARGVSEEALAATAGAAEAEVDAAMQAADSAPLAQWSDSEETIVKW